jgi:dienelactone hydrolase
MAGNVKEWCWNKVSGDKHYILGGAWDEPNYMFADWDAQSAMDRLPNYGFRCVKRLSGPIPEAVFADVPPEQRDSRIEMAVSDEQFRFIRSVYAYDKGPLNAEVTSRRKFRVHIHETVRFDAAYGTEKVPAHLYLPRNAQPPYQTVIYYPGADAWNNPPYPQEEPPNGIDAIVKSGRAVLCPIYQGAYERVISGPRPLGASRARDVFIQIAKDYFRSIDYVEQRTDLDAQKLAYFGISRGACAGPILLALDDRAKAAVLASGGLRTSKTMPELDLINFAPRVTVPILMTNGRNDATFPLETSQRPLFELLGTPEKDKSHLLFKGGHAGRTVEALPWFDKYLGPVRREPK